MKIFSGNPAYEGIAIGKIEIYRRNLRPIPRRENADVDLELEAFFRAKEQVGTELEQLIEQASTSVGNANAAIFEAHKTLLEDPELIQMTTNLIREEQVSAEYAIYHVATEVSEQFMAMQDPYLKARVFDIRDVVIRLVAQLQGVDRYTYQCEEPVILLADSLTPSELMRLDRNRILAIVTRRGSTYSHTAILARSMHIPSITGVDFTEDCVGAFAIVDAHAGQLLVEPNEVMIREYRVQIRRDADELVRLQAMKGMPSVTTSGQKISLLANIGQISDLPEVKEYDAEGIGLFRTEFLYLDRTTLPSEIEQMAIYRTVVEALDGKPMVIRTCDLGGDKKPITVDFSGEDDETYRGIRVCLKETQLFRTHLRAILQAAYYGEIWMMYPMITSAAEVEQIQEILREIEAQLQQEDVPYRMPKQGIMIETLEAYKCLDELAKQVDFFSIGTNDLTQALLQVHRESQELEEEIRQKADVLLAAIRHISVCAHARGIPVGICGELAADLEYTKQWIEMGIDSLSMEASNIWKIREKIRSI